ncbi:MAG: acpH [Gemmataceae bacterium]|nr:acpH [Gemmataceae bacterium]
MNFLAHLHLSDGSPGSMLGGIVADFVKPANVAILPADVRAGVHLHRLVDGFTDRHPVVQRSIGRIAGKYHWFSGIIIDIYYDHVLAREWPRYSTEPLRAFADRAYAALGTLLATIPDEAAGFIRAFIDDDRLLRYATPAGIEDTLARVSNRIARRIPKRAIRLESAMPDLLAEDELLGADFHSFYPELVAFAAGCKSAPPT